MGFRGGASGAGSAVLFAPPSESIEIGDPVVTGVSNRLPRADHGHAFPAPPAGSATDLAAVKNTGASNTPARADHVHGHAAAMHLAGGHADLSALLGGITNRVSTGAVAAAGTVDVIVPIAPALPDLNYTVQAEVEEATAGNTLSIRKIVSRAVNQVVVRVFNNDVVARTGTLHVLVRHDSQNPAVGGPYLRVPATAGLNSGSVLVPDSSLTEGIRWAVLAALGLAINVKDHAATSAQRAEVGNGASKPLSGFYATLALAQVAYPHATALTNELDWAVGQAAFKAAGLATVTTTPVGSYEVASAPSVFWPNGRYVFNEAFTFTTAGLSYVHVVSGGRAIFIQSDATKDTIDFRGAVRFEAEGIIFTGGKRHFLWGNNNIDGSQGFFDRCEFHNSADWSTETTLTGAWGTAANMSANLTYTRCRWANNYRVVKNVEGIFTVVEKSWVLIKGPNAVDGAHFENRNELHFREMYGVPDPAGPSPSRRWVDNYGQFHSDGSRFGGEGAGMPVVNHLGPAKDVYPWNGGGAVVIKGGAAAIGPDSGPQYLILFSGHIPQLIEVREVTNLTWASPAGYIKAAAGFDVSGYLSARHANTKFYINVENNLGYPPMDEGGIDATYLGRTDKVTVAGTKNLKLVNPTVGGGQAIVKHLKASAAQAASPSLADGASHAEVVTVAGAVLNSDNICFATRTGIAPADVMISAYVDSNNRVRITYLNKTGAAFTIPAGTAHVNVWQYS